MRIRATRRRALVLPDCRFVHRRERSRSMKRFIGSRRTFFLEHILVLVVKSRSASTSWVRGGLRNGVEIKECIES